MTSVDSSICKNQHSLIILSNAFPKKPMEVGPVLKYCISQSLGQSVWVELSLVVGPFGRNVEKYFVLYAAIQVFAVI